jgi:hypothetical protein
MDHLNQFYKGKVSRSELFIIFISICFVIGIAQYFV